MRWLSVVWLLTLVGLSAALSSGGSRLLVVLEEASEKDRYSLFWADLKERGYSISYESPKSEQLSLFRYDERQFDHILILPTKSKGLGPSLTPKLLLDFVSKDGNILLALSGETPTPNALSSLLLELGIVIPPDRSSMTIDHFNYDTVSAAEKHDVLLLPQPSPLRSDVKNFFGGSGTIAFPRAVAQTLDPSSPLLVPIVSAESTSYSFNPKEEADTVDDPSAVGTQIALASALQARNSARFAVLGSAEVLENKWFDATVQAFAEKKTKTVNREFAKQLTAWTFRETGVLRVGRVEHYLSETAEGPTGNDSVAQRSHLNPKIYRTKNDVTFTIELSEYNGQSWAPFNVPADDVIQLEFTMLSPFHRLPLKPIHTTADSTLFSTSFTCPDQHGIFSFRVNYKRPFLTNVEIKREITLRHFAHDEWPRSWAISGGWPYIAGVWVTIAGFVAFVTVWMYSEVKAEARPGKKNQ